jgi:hypothetical protein
LNSKRKSLQKSGIRRAGVGAGPPSVSDELQQLREILSNLASMLIMSGCSSKDLAREFAVICRKLTARHSADSSSRSSKFDHIHVISHWYHDPDYLDSVGKPCKLAFAGAQPSLSRLIARVLPGASPRGVLNSLLELGAVRQRGQRYEPTGPNVNFDQNSVHWAYWNRKALHSVLQNMVHNLSSATGHLYLARAAINPRFPVSKLPGFHARISRRALRFLHDVDGSMQRLEASGWQEQTTETGVLMFAFENPIRLSAGTATRQRPHRKSSRAITSEKSS